MTAEITREANSRRRIPARLCPSASITWPAAINRDLCASVSQMANVPSLKAVKLPVASAILPAQRQIPMPPAVMAWCTQSHSMILGSMSIVKPATWNNSATAFNFSGSEPSNTPKRTVGFTVRRGCPDHHGRRWQRHMGFSGVGETVATLWQEPPKALPRGLRVFLSEKYAIADSEIGLLMPSVYNGYGNGERPDGSRWIA